MEIKPGIHWVGAVDWESRTFHGHELSIHRGTSYNSYLIKDEKTALVDTVWDPFKEEFLANLQAVIDPAKIDYVVINHAEIDHSGSLPQLMRLAPNAQLIVSRKGADSVPGHFFADWDMQSVKTGDSLKLGRHTLRFVEAPMLHWPDSMFTYVDGASLLLSNDAFGQHYATAFRFNDQVNQAELYQEALKYYANILTPFSGLVSKKIKELATLKLPIDMIAPSHGVIWRQNPGQIVRQYDEWARQEPEARAVIVYDTMWHATRKMAEAIAAGLGEGGVDHRVYHAATADRNDVLAEIFKAGAVILGSPTLNNGLLPTIWPLLQDIKGLKFKNKMGGAFGSYGWSGEGVGIIEQHLAACKFSVPERGISCKWQPDREALAACRRYGNTLAAKITGSGVIP